MIRAGHIMGGVVASFRIPRLLRPNVPKPRNAPSNTGMQRTARCARKIGAFLKAGIGPTAVPNLSVRSRRLMGRPVAYSELLVGIALILGIFTHFAARMGVTMNLAYLLAGTTSTNPQMLVIGLIIFLLVAWRSATTGWISLPTHSS